jgi:hypothetical protein
MLFATFHLIFSIIHMFWKGNFGQYNLFKTLFFPCVHLKSYWRVGNVCCVIMTRPIFEEAWFAWFYVCRKFPKESLLSPWLFLTPPIFRFYLCTKISERVFRSFSSSKVRDNYYLTSQFCMIKLNSILIWYQNLSKIC